MKGLSSRWVRIMNTAIAVSISLSTCLFESGCEADERAGWRKLPPLAKDKNGDMPADVVRHFFEAARSNDYVRAQAYWFGESKGVGEDTSFPEFCKEYQQFKTYSIGETRRGKPGYYWVTWQGVCTNGEVVNSREYLENVNGYWRIIRGYNW